MTDYYVDSVTPGDDGNAGTSPAAAWETLTPVNSASLNPGDTVNLICDGTFSGVKLVISDSGTNGNEIVVQSYGSGADPQIINVGAASQWGIQVSGDYVDIDGIYFSGIYAAAVYFTSTASYCSVANCEMDSCGVGVHMSGTFCTVDTCNIHDTYDYGHWGQFGIYVDGTDNTIDGCTIADCTGYDGGGVELYAYCDRTTIQYTHVSGCDGFCEVGADAGDGSAADCTVAYCISYNNRRGPFFHFTGTYATTVDNFAFHNCVFYEVSTQPTFSYNGSPGATDLYVYNCAFYLDGNGGSPDIYDASGHTHDYNIYYPTNGAGVGVSLSANESNENPDWVNAPTDWHPQSVSPLRDAGTDLSYSVDYDGNSVPQETNPAIGVLEYLAAGAPVALLVMRGAALHVRGAALSM